MTRAARFAALTFALLLFVGIIASCWPRTRPAPAPLPTATPGGMVAQSWLPRVLSPERAWGRGAGVPYPYRHLACGDLVTLHVSWWYDWDTTGPACAGFVPMVWGGATVTSTLPCGAGGWLLTFNEPNLPAQSNMTPALAAALWPTLEATGCKLVSPAIYAGYAYADDWQAQWLAACAGCRFEALAVHWYAWGNCPMPAVDGFRTFLTAQRALADELGVELWLTEYGCYTRPEEFAALAVPIADELTDRQAIWAMYTDEYPNWPPLIAGGLLTDLGAKYAGEMP